MRGVAALGERVGDAVRKVLVEQLEGDGLQRPGRRRDLGQYVDAVRVVVDHALHAPYLTFDAAQPLLDRALLVFITSQLVTIPL